MVIDNAPGATKRLRRKYSQPSAHFEQTFETPLDRLPTVTRAVLAAHPLLEAGTVIIEAVVMAPKNLERLLAQQRLPTAVKTDTMITAYGPEGISALLVAAWSDWVDFYFAPEPCHYRLFADHDEYTTVLGARKGQVAKVATSLVAAGFRRVEDFERTW